MNHFALRINLSVKEIIYQDFLVGYRNGRKELIEIKPQFKLKEDKNKAKFKAATKYCKKNNIEFTVITQKDLHKMGIL
jgi:hypothetical protein